MTSFTCRQLLHRPRRWPSQRRLVAKSLASACSASSLLPIAFAAFIILDSYNYLDALKLKFSNFRRSSSERAPLASSSMAYNRPSTMMTGTA